MATVRFFVVSHGAISVLLFGLALRPLSGCVAHVTPVALVAIRPRFTEFVVVGLAWRGRRGPMVRVRGSRIRRCAEVYGVL